MKRRLPLFLFAILLFMSSTAVAQPKTTGNPQFDAAVQRAAAYLRANLKEDDTPGHYVLSAYALFKAGEPKESPIIQRAIKHATDSVASGTFRPQRPYDHLYESGLYCMFLADVDPELYRDQMQIMANYVASVQRPDGSWADTPQADGDISMCQYAVLALWAANRAKCQVSPEALDRTVSYHLSHRNQDGGYAYRPGASFGATGANSNRNMTMAALSSLGVARLLFYGPESAKKDKEKAQPEAKFGVLVKEEDEDANVSAVAFPDYRPRHSKGEITAGIERALAYETGNFNPVNNHPEFPNYFYYTIERALTVSEISLIKGEDWYVPYGNGLLTFQDGEGAFKEVHGGAIVGTSFALLYFMRSTKQIIEKTYGVGRQQGKRGNPFGDKEVKREPTELDLLIADMENLDINVDDAPIEVADEIVRSVISIDDPEELVGQADKLKSLMKHPNADVRKSACWALGRTGDFKLVPFMLDGIRDPSVDVNVEAIAALRFIARKPNGFGETLNPLEGVENPTDEEKVRIVNSWRQKAINSWSAWYAQVRPHEDQDGFDQLLLAVPLNSKAVEESKK